VVSNDRFGKLLQRPKDTCADDIVIHAPCISTIAGTDLMLSGVLRRFPDTKFFHWDPFKCFLREHATVGAAETSKAEYHRHYETVSCRHATLKSLALDLLKRSFDPLLTLFRYVQEIFQPDAVRILQTSL